LIDVLEFNRGLLVIVALPGVRPDDMQIGILDGQLLVSGTRRWPISQRPVVVHRVELPHGHFERRLPLPCGAYQIVEQDHSDGCLLITLRRVD
jgi:HSP20 family molecular chaperone IbpA